MVIVERPDPYHFTTHAFKGFANVFVKIYITILSNVMVIVERPESYHQQTIL